MPPTVKERERGLRSSIRRSLNLEPIPATIITRDGAIFDPLIPGNYWASYQTSNGLSTTRSVKPPATSMPIRAGSPVMLEFFRGRLRIRELDTDRMLSAGDDPITEIQKPYKDSTPQGRFETLRLIPKSGLTVSLKSWPVIIDNVYYEFSYPDIDLTANVPTAGNMRYATILVKDDFATIEVINSTPRPETDVPLGDDDVNECLALSSAGSTATWSVKLVEGQTAVTQADIDNDARDLRNIVNNAPGTGSTAAALLNSILSDNDGNVLTDNDGNVLFV